MDSAWVQCEMSGAKLGDPRQVVSLTRITAALCANYGASLSAACGPALRQAAHRIFEHEETSIDGLLAGHYAATSRRCAELPVVLIAQDTTVFSYAQEQIDGLGRVNRSGKTGGLLAHSALALTEDGTPLGLLHLAIWGACDGNAPCAWEKESGKWQAALAGIAARLAAGTRAVLIQDREADFFDFLAADRPEGIELLVRACQDRRVKRGNAEADRLFKAAASGELLGEMSVQVPVTAKEPNSGQIIPRQRTAVLELRVCEVTLPRPATSQAQTKAVTLRLIQAQEAAPPEGEKALSWTLLTTLAVPDLPTARRIVGYYSRRWIIERLHFTLKSGMKAERLQIDDARSLAHCLAVYYVIAWRLLQMTYLAREDPDRPAAEVLAADEIAVLETASKRAVVTLREAIREIARLGGYEYYRNAPPPGVKRIWMGWQKLTAMVQGWRLRAQSMIHD